MHEAYNIYSLLKPSVHIESIAAFDNNIIIGTITGQLLMYSVNKNDDGKMELQLLKFEKNFSKKPIVQLEAVPDQSILFSLSDNLLNVSDMNKINFPIIYSALQTKGASLFCVDVQRNQSLTGEIASAIRLCVAIKRKLQFWYWKVGKLPEKSSGIEVKNLPKALSAAGDWKFGILLELCSSIEVKDLPKALSWTGNCICVGFKDEYILYNIANDYKKHELVVTSSSHSQDPCICVIKNNYFGLAKDEFIVFIDTAEIVLRDEMEKQAKKQALKQLSNKQGNKQLTPEKLQVLETVTKKKPVKPLIWSQSVLNLVWDDPYAIGRTANYVEIRCLDSNGLNNDTLIQTIPELGKARFIVRAAKGIIFAATLSELWYIEAVDIPKQRQTLLQQKKFQLAIELTNISDEPAEDKKEIVRQIKSRFARELFANKQFAEAMHEFTELQADAYDVIKLFPNLLPQDYQQKTSPSHTDVGGINMPVLDDKEMENAILALQDFLIAARQHEIQKMQDNKISTKSSGLLSIIDTTLLKCYLQTNDHLIAPLLRLNHCHLEESEKTLKKHKKLSELIILYQTIGKHQKALELLQSEANVSGSSLQGYSRTINYLQYLGKENKHLIFEFSDWILKEAPEEGLKIFTEDFIEVENLPRAEILNFLLKSHKQSVIPYLEHIIHVWKEDRPMFHNYLIHQYRERIQKLKTEIEKNDTDQQKNTELMEALLAKHIDFLKKSDRYSAEVVLKDCPSSELFEERAIILGKLKKHQKVLAIYLQILGDINKAKEYCEQVYPEEEDIFAILIQTVLTIPKQPPYTGVKLHESCLKPNYESVRKLLDEYGDKVDPLKILQHIPDDMPLIYLNNFFEITLRTQLERKRKNQILKALLKSEKLQLQEHLMHYKQNSFVLSDFTTCPVCKKRFINQSAFIRYPTGEIVHILCKDKMDEQLN